MESARFPFLSANVKNRDGTYLARPFMIKQFGKFKVAIFGLTTKETETTGNPENIKEFIFEDEVEVAKKLVPMLKKEADVVIALVHMGLYPSCRKGSKRLASEVSGIDLIVDGHTHTRLDFPILIKNAGSDHRTIIVQAWKWGLILGRIDLWIQNKKVTDFKFEAIPVNLKTVEKKKDGSKAYHFIGKEIKEDQKLLRLLQPYLDTVEPHLSEVIGHAEGTFFAKGLRTRETALGDIVADSMLWHTKYMGVDFAIQNGGGIRSDLPEGRITRDLVDEILPFDNSVVVVTLNGFDVVTLFDYIASIKRGRGAFPQVSKGLNFTIDYKAGRCVDILINGKPINPNRDYKIALNSYLANGGDGYRVFLKAIDRFESSMFQRDVFIEYIKFLGGTIRPQVKNRIKVRYDDGVYFRFEQAA
jgi:5'-nucleotidase/UDP-sugar diphosphatase